ncbi:uncharacterized protein V6R79_011381 [Siganus canaliculatus]
MAERNSDNVFQPKQRPSSSRKAERSTRVEAKPQAKPASAPIRKHTDDLLATEEKYKLLNAELEAKTADLKEQNEALSKPLSILPLSDIMDEEDSRTTKPHQCTAQQPAMKTVTKKRATSAPQKMRPGKQPHCKTPTQKHAFQLEEAAAVGDSAECFLAKTIRSIEEKMDDPVTREHVAEDASNIDLNEKHDAHIRVLMAKLRIMQEELDQFSSEVFKKEDENANLSAKIKELEEERARLQKTTSIQQMQVEKFRALSEESGKKCDGLHLQVSALNKDIENLNRTHKQAAALHSTTELRMNRALEEVEKLKTQLNKTKQMNKDKMSEEQQSKESLLAENKMLKKQKNELIVGFKKQLRLIDILKRQKMHFEAAKLLSFTEDEFMKALDWGKS